MRQPLYKIFINNARMNILIDVSDDFDMGALYTKRLGKVCVAIYLIKINVNQYFSSKCQNLHNI